MFRAGALLITVQGQTSKARTISEPLLQASVVRLFVYSPSIQRLAIAGAWRLNAVT
jgi:hypothetical protein